MSRVEPRRQTITVWTPSHLKNPKLEPLVFAGVRRLSWGVGYEVSSGADLVLNHAHIVAVRIDLEPTVVSVEHAGTGAGLSAAELDAIETNWPVGMEQAIGTPSVSFRALFAEIRRLRADLDLTRILDECADDLGAALEPAS